ncbi:AAA family ATPase [Spirosoma fluviale]|nr:AAA family ATPase [Spirosoma fluviale]
MEKLTVKKLSDLLFAELTRVHFNQRGAVENFFFMLNEDLRQVEESKIPFLVNYEQEYISISFWNGLNSVNRQYNISLDIYTSGQMKVIIRKDHGIEADDLPELNKAIRSKAITGSNNIPYELKIDNIDVSDFDSVAIGQALLDVSLKPIAYKSESTITTWVIASWIVKTNIDKWVLRYGTSGRSVESLAPSEYFRSETFYASPIRAGHFDEMLQNVQRVLKASQERQEPVYSLPNTPEMLVMPVRLVCVEIRNYKGIKHTKVDQIAPNIRWIFLTGENGFGKSSVLQALTIGLWGATDERSLLSETDDPIITVDYYQQNVFGHTSFSRNTTQPSLPNAEPIPMAAYGAGRLLSGGTIPSERSNRRAGAVTSLFYSQSQLFNVEFELIKSFAYNRPYFNLLTKTFCQLIPDLADIKINTTKPDPSVEYYEKDHDGKSYTPVKLSDLAAGFRNLLAFVGDMVLRLSANQDQFDNWQSLSGIVIIDELELYLHPKYQRALPGKLSELFPNVQFIASTHSPIPLLGAPKETLVLTVDRNEEMGVVVNQTGVDFSKLTPNAILTSPIFGFEHIIPEAAGGNSAEVATEDRYENAVLMQKLKADYGIKSTTSQLL